MFYTTLEVLIWTLYGINQINKADASGNEISAIKRSFAPRLTAPVKDKCPSIENVLVSEDKNQITIYFNAIEGVDQRIAETRGHYVIEGVEILEVKALSDTSNKKATLYDRVVLTTTPLKAETDYKLQVKYIEDGSESHTSNYETLGFDFTIKEI